MVNSREKKFRNAKIIGKSEPNEREKGGERERRF